MITCQIPFPETYISSYMKRMKLYEADDKMIDLISDNHSMLQGLSAFGIRLGFGDKTVSEICNEQGVDCYTFLTVVNFLINGYTPRDADDRISVKTILDYLLCRIKLVNDNYLVLQELTAPEGTFRTLIGSSVQQLVETHEQNLPFWNKQIGI